MCVWQIFMITALLFDSFVTEWGLWDFSYVEKFIE